MWAGIDAIWLVTIIVKKRLHWVFLFQMTQSDFNVDVALHELFNFARQYNFEVRFTTV